jgi:hypothetical protein
MEVGLRPEVNTAYGRFVASRVGFSLQRLIHLDELWTADLEAAAGRGRLEESEIEAVQQQAAEMERELGEARRHSGELRMMLNDTEDGLIDRAFQSIAGAEGAPGAVIDLAAQLDDYEIRSAAIAGCDYLAATADAEAAAIREKVTKILSSGEVPPGDLGAAFRCAALIALVGAGTISVIGLGGPLGLVAMGAVSQVGLGALCWMQENCSARIQEIAGRRR